jgi:hypothetical protein
LAFQDGTKFKCTKLGVPDFTWSKHIKREKYTKWTQPIPNSHKLYQMTEKYSKWAYNITTFSIRMASKFYPNWDFWFEKKPSGNLA